MRLTEFYKSVAKNSEYPFVIRFIVLIASSWIFQGVLYMDRTERTFKIVTELIILIFSIALLHGVLSIINAIIISLIFCHTMNWIFNGQIFVVLKNLKMIMNPPECFSRYVEDLTERIGQKDCIIAAAAYGSISKRRLENSSDLDVRIVRKSGIQNGIKACTFVAVERSRALIKRFPLDIYILDDIHKIEQQIDKTEVDHPVILYDPDRRLKV